MININIDDVIVENRVRQRYGISGELDALERSIQQMGVLQPIGITKENKLIFGGRRLRACKNIGMRSIPAIIIDIDSNDPVKAIRMEQAENEIRLDFTPSERVEIARRIEESLSGRHGSNQFQQKGEDVPTLAHPPEEDPPIGKSRDIAAKAVDMKPETYRKAKTVVDSGNHKVIEKMDKKELTVNAAYKEVKKEQSAVTIPEKQKVDEFKPLSLKITLYENLDDSAIAFSQKVDKEIGSKFALSLLKAYGHKIDIGS